MHFAFILAGVSCNTVFSVSFGRYLKSFVHDTIRPFLTNHICPQMFSSSLLSIPSLTSTFHHFMWSDAVEVVRGPSCSSPRCPRNFECNFNPGPPCVLYHHQISRLLNALRRQEVALIVRHRNRLCRFHPRYCGYVRSNSSNDILLIATVTLWQTLVGTTTACLCFTFSTRDRSTLRTPVSTSALRTSGNPSEFSSFILWVEMSPLFTSTVSRKSAVVATRLVALLSHPSEFLVYLSTIGLFRELSFRELLQLMPSPGMALKTYEYFYRSFQQLPRVDRLPTVWPHARVCNFFEWFELSFSFLSATYDLPILYRASIPSESIDQPYTFGSTWPSSLTSEPDIGRLRRASLFLSSSSVKPSSLDNHSSSTFAIFILSTLAQIVLINQSFSVLFQYPGRTPTCSIVEILGIPFLWCYLSFVIYFTIN